MLCKNCSPCFNRYPIETKKSHPQDREALWRSPRQSPPIAVRGNAICINRSFIHRRSSRSLRSKKQSACSKTSSNNRGLRSLFLAIDHLCSTLHTSEVFVQFFQVRDLHFVLSLADSCSNKTAI